MSNVHGELSTHTTHMYINVVRTHSPLTHSTSLCAKYTLFTHGRVPQLTNATGREPPLLDSVIPECNCRFSLPPGPDLKPTFYVVCRPNEEQNAISHSGKQDSGHNILLHFSELHSFAPWSLGLQNHQLPRPRRKTIIPRATQP